MIGKTDEANHQYDLSDFWNAAAAGNMPYAKVNFIDHQITDQTSILRFIEDNWNLRRIGNQSFDEKAGLLTNMFDFTSNRHLTGKLLLDPSTALKVAATTTITTTTAS
jgi:phospholipase C